MAILTRIQATLCNFNFAIDIKGILPLLLVAIFLHKRTFGKEVEDRLMIFFFKKKYEGILTIVEEDIVI